MAYQNNAASTYVLSSFSRASGLRVENAEVGHNKAIQKAKARRLQRGQSRQGANALARGLSARVAAEGARDRTEQPVSERHVQETEDGDVGKKIDAEDPLAAGHCDKDPGDRKVNRRQTGHEEQKASGGVLHVEHCVLRIR